MPAGQPSGPGVHRPAHRGRPRRARGRPVRQERRPSRLGLGAADGRHRAARPARPTCRRSTPVCTRRSPGTLGPGQVSTWSFTVSSTLGNGELKAEVATTSGTLQPRLTLSGATGQVLIQSDSGQIVQSLQPGTYLLTVSQAAGAGAIGSPRRSPRPVCPLPRSPPERAPTRWRWAT